MEVSNRCSSDCLFCGWRASNPDIPRTRISAELVLEQVDYLLDLGIGYIELVGGDDLQFVREALPDLARATRERMTRKNIEGQVCVCSMAVTEKHYREWKSFGVDSMFVWQETYDPALYAEKIVAGPKARGITDDWKLGSDSEGYLFRALSQERARRAGLDVGLGFMLGLDPDINYEFLMALQHVHHLLRAHDSATSNPVILGMPTWNKITTPRTDTRPNGLLDLEEAFPFLAAVLFLSLPKGRAWVFPNCRVSLKTQVKTIAIAGPFTSTEVKLGPGGYMPAALRRRAARGEKVDALRELVRKECGIGCEDLERMERELDRGEQFVHHFHSHQVYMEALQKEGFEAVPFSELAAVSKAAAGA